ncbi:MAG: quinoprotein dehydrogenase-associated SoxYZ-like carrier [Burkholderiaceae bacterium]|nr:quinoprotein dehydrogenase-associated SoxYZ-like carrier [Burkholderiaceae bacterium]
MAWHVRAFIGAAAVAAAQVAGAAPQQPTDDPQASPVWQKVQASLFEGRPVQAAPAGLLTLEVPSRATDAAVVPVAIRARLPAGSAHHVSRLYLLIDANPSPISAVFQLSPRSGRAEVETRVRVDDYSFVRAIAETSDGQLYGVVRFVKASGGCSAPAGTDARAAEATLGQMSLRVDGDLNGALPVLAQLAIKHPNHSGLAMDQATRQFTPAHYVRKVEVTYRGEPVFAADVDFSISENPNFRFYFLPRGAGELRATVVDSHDRRFAAVQTLNDRAR